MEYERIHKVQTGIISPSKLRMKLMGLHNGRKKDTSNSNSSRTSPSKLDDTEFVKNSLLGANNGDFDDPFASSGVPSMDLTREAVLDQCHGDPKENANMGLTKIQEQFSKIENGNSSAIHPMRMVVDENLDYDSNASSSSFEFHNERSLRNHLTRSISTPMPSKWNDAEKWIMNRQNQHQPSYAKKNPSSNQSNRMPTVRVAPLGARSIHGPANEGIALIDQHTQSMDLKEMNLRELHCKTSSALEPTVVPVVRSVCMRDMGTEMTPAMSLEPSTTATPVDATTPFRSPTSSIPSTPRRGEPAPTPTDTDNKAPHASESCIKELTEQELKEKTRREIVALGIQLGKMNIAAWASKEKIKSPAETTGPEELERMEYEKHAAAWEEVEKSKHLARYKREEIRIQAWESHQKATLEAEMQRIEAQVEQMRAQAHAKMVKKISVARHKSEQKRAAAEARRHRDAERTAVQAEYIRQTGRVPTSHYICCGWLS